MASSVASQKFATKVHDHSITLVARKHVETTEPRASASGPTGTHTYATFFRDATLAGLAREGQQSAVHFLDGLVERRGPGRQSDRVVALEPGRAQLSRTLDL